MFTHRYIRITHVDGSTQDFSVRIHIVCNPKSKHTLTICMYGSDTLKFAAEFACQTTLTFVKKNEPRLPCSEDRFHTPTSTHQGKTENRKTEKQSV